MKMKDEDFEALKAAVNKVIIANSGAYKAYQEAGLSNKRYNWDLLRASGFDICPLYSYLHDDHIDTALRLITGKR